MILKWARTVLSCWYDSYNVDIVNDGVSLEQTVPDKLLTPFLFRRLRRRMSKNVPRSHHFPWKARGCRCAATARHGRCRAVLCLWCTSCWWCPRSSHGTVLNWDAAGDSNRRSLQQNSVTSCTLLLMYCGVPLRREADFYNIKFISYLTENTPPLKRTYSREVITFVVRMIRIILMHCVGNLEFLFVKSHVFPRFPVRCTRFRFWGPPKPLFSAF